LGFEVTEKKVRKAVHQGRAHLLKFIIDEVAATLVRPTMEEIEEELIDLGLHTICKRALIEHFGGRAVREVFED
jgi:hypothetical protein